MATVKTADIQIRLCSVPELGLDYNNTLDFKTKTNQLNYFSQRTIKTTTGRISVDGERQTLFINSNLDEIKNCDYLYMPDEYGKYFFYFITGKSYKTSSTTKLDIEIDVFQTYLFDFELLDSFIERTHVHRWTETGEPYINLVDEGMEIGPYHIEKQTKLYPLSENYVITATNPLGTLGGNYPSIDDEERVDSNPDWGSKPDRPIPTPPTNDFDIPGGDGSEGSGSGGSIPSPPPFPTDNDGVPITYEGRTYYTNLLQNYNYSYPYIRVAYGNTVWSYRTYTQLLTPDLYKYRNGTLYETDKGRKVFLNNVISSNSYLSQKGNGMVPDEFRQYMDDGDYGNWIVIRYGINSSTKILITYLDTINYNVNDTIPKGIISIGTVSDKETVGSRSRCFILAKYGKRLEKVNSLYATYTKLGIGLYENNENINEYPNTTNGFEPSLKFPFKCGNVVSRETTDNTLYCQVYKTEKNKSPKIISPISGIVVANGTTGGLLKRGTAENVVFIKREDGLEFRVSGLSQINVTVGQNVNIGDVIGLAGKEVYEFSGWSRYWNNYNFYICAIELVKDGTSIKYSDYSKKQFFQPPTIGSTEVDYNPIPIIPPTEAIKEIHKEDLDKFYIEDISKDPELYHMFDIINEQNEEKQKILIRED